MIAFDKKPGKIRAGHLINWVSVDDFVNLDESTAIIYGAYPQIMKNIKAHVDSVDDPAELIGTVLTTKNGAVKVHNIFISRTVNDELCVSPFAAAKGLREIFDIMVNDPKPKCYIGKLDNSIIWKSLKSQIVALEARHKMTIWCWLM